MLDLILTASLFGCVGFLFGAIFIVRRLPCYRILPRYKP